MWSRLSWTSETKPIKQGGISKIKWVFSEDFKIVNDWECQMLIRNIDDYNDVFDVDNAVDGCDYDDSF